MLLPFPVLYTLTERSVKEVVLAYMILAVAFMITSGIVLANYEMHKQRQARSERLRQRARRCVRRDDY